MAKLTQKGQARYDQIMEKSMLLFNDRGYASTSMDEIAQECGCDVANLYNYFPGKENLLFGVIKEMISGAIDMCIEIDNNKKLRPDDKLKAVILHQMEGRIRLGFTDLYSKYKINLTSEHAQEIVAMRDKYDHLLRKLVTECVAAGEFREINVKLAVIAIGAFIERIVVWYSPKGELSLSQIVDQYWDLLVKGTGLKESARAGNINKRPDTKVSTHRKNNVVISTRKGK
jgi:TetR/AcrR family transcriptional regulator, cholesterol catabolism regulator